MKMRIVIAAIALSLLIGPAAAQQEVSLVGTWTGERDRSAKVEGYRSGTATLVITEQKGRAFKGYLLRSNTDGDVKEDSGVRSRPAPVSWQERTTKASIRSCSST